MLRRLVDDHDVSGRAPLSIAPGDEVVVGERDTEWPAFVFVTHASGSGWVPARYIDVQGTSGSVITGYDTTELPAKAGAIVEIVRDDPESGWAWCRDGDGREGWVPHRLLDTP